MQPESDIRWLCMTCKLLQESIYMNRDNHDPCTLATTCNICPKTKHQYCLCQISYSRSLAACVCFVDSCLSFCTFSFGHYVVCSFSIYELCLPLWYCQSLLKITKLVPHLMVIYYLKCWIAVRLWQYNAAVV